MSTRHDARRRHVILQKVAHVIGSSLTVYNMLLGIVRSLFAHSGSQRRKQVKSKKHHFDAVYCTLRSEMVMLLHDREITEVLPWPSSRHTVEPTDPRLRPKTHATNWLGAWMPAIGTEPLKNDKYVRFKRILIGTWVHEETPWAHTSVP